MSRKRTRTVPNQPSPVFCDYCGKWFVPGLYKFRQKWHQCEEAIAAREQLHKEKERMYDKNVRPLLKDRPKVSRMSSHCSRNAFFLAEGAKLYQCKSKGSADCWGMSPNRFNCPPCLERLEGLDGIRIDVLGHSTLDPPRILW